MRCEMEGKTSTSPVLLNAALHLALTQRCDGNSCPLGRRRCVTKYALCVASGWVNAVGPLWGDSSFVVPVPQFPWDAPMSAPPAYRRVVPVPLSPVGCQWPALFGSSPLLVQKRQMAFNVTQDTHHSATVKPVALRPATPGLLIRLPARRLTLTDG